MTQLNTDLNVLKRMLKDYEESIQAYQFDINPYPILEKLNTRYGFCNWLVMNNQSWRGPRILEKIWKVREDIDNRTYHQRGRFWKITPYQIYEFNYEETERREQILKTLIVRRDWLQKAISSLEPNQVTLGV